MESLNDTGMNRGWLSRRSGAGAWRYAAACVIAAAGCNREEPARTEQIRPVKSMLVAAGSETTERSFPGRTEATREVELAFQVSGLLVDLPVREGQMVAKGDVIGVLRQQEFQARLGALKGQLEQAQASLRALRAGERPEERLRLESQVRAAEARLAHARAEFARYEELIKENAVARTDYELAETDYRVAQENVKVARQAVEIGAVGRQEDIEAREAEVRSLESRVNEATLQLADSTLRAPFAGEIAQRFVDANQNISAGRAVVRLQGTDEITVAMDLPEAVMAGDIRSANTVKLEAEFTAIPGRVFPVEVREVSQVADPVTQTFRVRAAMKSPPGVSLRPGMTATVRVTQRREGDAAGRISVPVTAVLKDSLGEPVVWVLGSDGVVHRRPVKLGPPSGESVVIVEGLKTGERIAVAGVTKLRDGMRVRDLGDALGGRRQ